MQPEHTVQGSLSVMFQMQEMLKQIGGFAAVSLQPAAGAHGELSGLLMIRAYFKDKGEPERCHILVPDTAHGTNPASSIMAGFDVVELPTDDKGNISLAALKAACSDKVAALMLTNPNTLGLFEQQIEDVIACVHDCGGLVYGDGANMNALTGIIRFAWRTGCRCDALQSAQDVRGTARRWWAGLGSGRRWRVAAVLSARTGRRL